MRFTARGSGQFQRSANPQRDAVLHTRRQVFPERPDLWQHAIQGNWTHNFSPRTINEAIFGANRVEGVLGSGAKDYSVPSIAVNGINTEGGQAFGVGFAQGD